LGDEQERMMNKPDYSQLAGWCSPEKREHLRDLIMRDRIASVVELGVFGGSSLIPIGEAIRDNGSHGMVVGIDPWDASPALEGIQNQKSIDYWAKLPYSEVMAGCELAIRDFGISDYVRLMRMTGDAAVSQFVDDSLDLLHCDGNHSAEPAMRDAQNWYRKVKVGGWWVADDLGWTEAGVETVRPAVNWLLANGYEWVCEVTGCGFLRRVK
jgi:hypothetical protein